MKISKFKDFECFLLLFITLWMPVIGQITPPPPIGDRPVISDNRIWYLNHIPKRCQPPIIDRFNGGGVIVDNRALVKKDNPHIIRGNIEIAPSGCLYIEPGCILKFAPGMGMIVNGTLIARGSTDPGGRIVMTKAEGQDLGRPSGNWQDDARLTMGNTTKDGRLELKFKYKWRAICTNYNNFTLIDANVTCRHLGFLKGNFTYHSFARNLTDYILWEKPDCKGDENSLFDCPGAVQMQIGRHICDGQEVVGFECEGLRPGLALDHWRSIDFYNSSTEAKYQIQNNNRVYMNESLSFLEYIDISYTGLDTYHGKTSEPNIFYQKAAISSSPYVPMMNNVTVLYGAYDALNFTEIIGPIHIANSTFAYNRGYGMFIQSSVGRTLVNMTEVHHNWGDGIKFYLSNLTIFDFRRKFPPESSMCAQANTEGASYPFYQYMDLVQVNGDELTMVSVGGSCDRMYYTSENMKIGVHFMIMERDPEANGTFIFQDGGFLAPEIRFPINNGSFPESFTTKNNRLYVKFVYSIPRNKVCKVLPSCIRFLLEFTSNYDVEEEFRLIMSNVHDNIGYGVNIQDMRSKIRVSNETVISNNQFGAGIHVYKGAGEIVINGTRIENNMDAGINITYSGGYQLINNTQLISNKGYGIITEYMRLNRTRIESRNKVEVVRATFMWNEFIGYRMGNYCLGGDFLVNESYFAYNYDDAIEYLSCNRSTMYKTKIKIAFNRFNDNFRHAILMRPLLNTEGIITNNTFSNHTLATFRIDNGFDLLLSRWYRDFPVNLNIFENEFSDNSGRYVVSLRLTQYSAPQNIDCKFNNFIRNEINNSFMYVNPRSRANAVIVLSSNNVKLMRNHINNPDSVREIATHLTDPSIKLNAKENYWGTEINKQSDYEKVYNSIFDQDDRYNLAQIEYHPALRTLRLYDDYLSTDIPQYVWSFQRGNVIGGVLETSAFIVGAGKTYYVDKDIYVFKDKTLLLEPNSKLKFATSIGIVVHGLLTADGINLGSPVILDVDDQEEFVPMENRTASIRLVDGRDEFEGRLEVEINGQWGTVCWDGWIEENSMLACLQLGLAFNREYPTARDQKRAPDGTPVLMSWVSCDEVDTDFTKCRAVNADAHTCSHDKDVYLRCFRPTWAGVTLAAAYRHDQNKPMQVESQIRHVKIFNGGLLDPDTSQLTPALRIDYNYYQISHLTVQNSMSDGVSFSYNHPFALNRMEYFTLLNNAGNGLVTKSPKLDLMHSRIENNLKAGFMYDPFFSEYDALLVRNMIYPDRRINMFGMPTRTLAQEQIMFLICDAGSVVERKTLTVELRGSSPSNKLALQVLDYLPVESAEKVTVYDSSVNMISSSNIKRWELEKDLVDFPILSSSSVLTIQLQLSGQLSGRLAFAVICRQFDTQPPQLRTAVTNTSFIGNNQGIVTKHYNNPSNRRLEIFHRHVEEELYFKDLKVLNSVRHAMHMPSVTKFTDDYIPSYEDMTRPERIARINYTVFQSIFTDNTYGILAEHNHVDFANNVWLWNIDHVTLQGSKQGGLEIEVPRVNDLSEGKAHAVSIVDSVFQNNLNFACTVAGYYANVEVQRNKFMNNKCLLGLVSITGMEKNLTVSSNLITGNIGRYMIDIDISSHSENATSFKGQMNLNRITGNRYEGVEPPGAAISPKKYAVAVKGLQDMSGSYNIFNNPDLSFEFVAGITALTLGNVMDLTLNYWGVTDQPSIRKRIFDFDDWNNYVIAKYFPYLTKDDPNSIPSTGSVDEIHLDPNQLGGRVEKSQILMEIGRPYIVKSDLTVMPGITLTIPPGTDLQFFPNVGILVLGRLDAKGLPFARIKMRPLQPEYNYLLTGRKKRDLDSHEREKQLTATGNLESHEREKRQAATANIRLRGDGTLFKNAGFLELYNASSKTWNMMCDSQFHEKTAEVVCRELGKETINVKVRFTYLYDYFIYGKPMYMRKEFWYNTYNCGGDETSLSQCVTRYNYNLLPCIFAANYTFITCGDRNLESGLNYWGNVRFAKDSFEEQPLQADIGIDRSYMTYVDIEGAGMLHGEKVGAIQTTYTTPIFENINITKCAENGYDIIAPRQDLNIQRQNISGNLGFGINALILNGESSDRRSSFLPNGPSTIPYNVYGLVDICRMEKEIFLETRMILFYKYGPLMRDCVKVIRTRRFVGLRFLQINLFQEDFNRNMVEIFDGRTVDQIRLGRLMANSSSAEIQQLYQTTGDTMAVHVHASISFGSYGFVAEVVKLPMAGLTYPNSEFNHKLSQAEIRKNEDGAIQYKNIGETTPNLFIEHCYISENGFPILNLTSPPTIDISLQSTISFRFSHNQVSYNYGGMYLFAHTTTINTALKGNITNNVFAFGKNGEALNISGHYFQRLMFHQNYIYNYTAGDYRDIFHVKNVVVNLTHNYMLRNLGHYILHLYNNDDSAEPQLYSRNGIYNNNSTALRESTIKIGQGRPKFINNFLVNDLNDFEIETYPKPQQDAGNIDAKTNWWGSERRAYINGKTYDASDDARLVEVDFWPPILDNRSLVEGNCLPGWVLDTNRCYRYMGGALPYQKAKEFCLLHGAYLAEAKDREGFFNYLLRLMVIDMNWAQRVWVMSETGNGRCASFEQNYIVYEQDCARLYYPFICETDPLVAAPTQLTEAIQAMIIGICVGVGGVIILIIIIVAILWCLKSKRREKERFERTASIRSSINNLNKINSSLRGTKSTLTILSDVASRRRMNEFDERSVVSSVAKPSQGSEYSSEVAESVHSEQSEYEIAPRVLPATLPKDQGRPVPRDQGRPMPKDQGRPVHSLRPNRTGASPRPANVSRDVAKVNPRLEQDRERERKRMEQERRNMKKEEESSDESVEKEDFDSDSTFDEDEDENDKQVYKNTRVTKSQEQLYHKQATPVKPGLHRAVSEESDSTQNSTSSKSVSSFTDPIMAPSKDIFPPRSASKDPLPNTFSKRSVEQLDKKSLPLPAPRPKPAPPLRPAKDEIRQPLVPATGRWSPASSETSQGSHSTSHSVINNRLYTNEPGPQVPVYDPVYTSAPHNYKNTPGSAVSSNRTPLYDPVYEGSNSGESRSTGRYEPIDYTPVRKDYGVSQEPDTDYMPRPMGKAALNSSRDRLAGPPTPNKPTTFRGPLVSDIDSYTPSHHSNVDYMPRAPLTPSTPSDRSYQNTHMRGSRDQLDTMSRPPTYNEAMNPQSRSQSRDRLNYTNVPSAQSSRGSRDHLDRPDVMYLQQQGGNRHKESVETEI